MDETQKDEFGRLLAALQTAEARGEFKQAEAIGAQCLLLAAEEAQRNPSASLRLIGEAYEHEDAARWAPAEAAHRQALALVQAEGNAAMICNAHDKLSVFYAMLGNVDRALAESQAAVAAARTTGMAILLSTALRGLCRCHLIKGDIAPAAAAAEEAVRIMPAEKMSETVLARALLMRARCRVEQREVVQAGQDLTIAWQILAPRAEATMFGGIQNGLAGWWEITARIRTQAKDFAGAAEALGKAVEFRRAVSNLPHFAGAQKYHALAEVLQEYAVALAAAGKAAATAAFDESRKIQRRTGIPIPASSAV